MRHLLRSTLLAAAAGFSWCPAGAAGATAAQPFHFADATEAAGIDFRHYDGSSGRK